MVITTILLLFTTFWGKGWLKIDIENCCWRLKEGRRVLKSVFLFSPMLDTNFMNLGQIAHKLWILSLFFLFTTFGDERVAKK